MNRLMSSIKRVLGTHKSTHDFSAPVKLHIGGRVRREGWLIYDALDDDYVDIVGNCNDLSMFPDESCSDIYCSHVLEHFSHRDELPNLLNEFRRMLTKDGKLRLSVPDLRVLCKLFLDEDLSFKDKVFVVKVIYGAQLDPYDFHKTGFDQDILVAWMRDCGFARLERVEQFGLFPDSSTSMIKGHPISINIIATK